VRIHWTGCPNSCGQPQVADIGFMGTKTRKDGKAVEAVDIFMGGRVGKDAHLGEKVMKAIPCEDLKPVLRQLLVEQFNAKLKPGLVLEEEPGAEPNAATAPGRPPVKASFHQTIQTDSQP
jgi:ferredoxin-nitrite reductase